MDPRADLRTMATRGWGVSEGTRGRRRLDEGVKQESQKSWHAIAQPGDSENGCVFIPRRAGGKAYVLPVEVFGVIDGSVRLKLYTSVHELKHLIKGVLVIACREIPI